MLLMAELVARTLNRLEQMSSRVIREMHHTFFVSMPALQMLSGPLPVVGVAEASFRLILERV
jgi:hypothetical protein